ncbi:MBL fold metallo-hydrolase [Halalkalibacter alkalisediminis]|uniref:MBL fold metallo-hydrolase n=1 Tax=Halalkalibacter alkalisediminis TaxID=935616 RepID=A0ABV6NHZ0_9BACI|nr:MBL fold metallo-hydrolase [Halalkalibacter alkalisediminis]
MSKSILVFLFTLTFLLGGCGTDSTSVFEEKDLLDELDEKEVVAQQDTHSDSTGQLSVHFIDVGQADSTLLTYSDADQHWNILIDAGNWDSDQVIKYLHAHEITEIDLLVGTHPHADHIGQMDRILQDFQVSEIWMSGDETTSQTFERLLDAILESDVDYHEPRAGELYDLGALTLEILNPVSLTGDAHEGSVSIKVSYRNVSFLFTGDAEHQTERAMIERGHDLKATVLKLGHHGSNTSTSPDFLESVKPEIAIISAGEVNQYGHPHEEVVSRVQDAGIEIYSTSIHGTIVITTDGDDYLLKTKEDEIPSPPDKDQSQVSDCVNINEATEAELERIIHIGTERAKSLIELRPFETLNDLVKINGIGPGRLADILSENVACMGGS